MTILRTNTIAGIGETFGPLLDGDLEFNSQNYIILPKGSSNQQGVLRTTEDVIGVGGTYYDNLVLAMPFNEATGLRDVSSRNRNPAAYGNVAISTAQSKYYGSSAYFDGSDDYLSIDVGISTSTSDFVLGPSGSDFTIEMYLYATSSANGGIISTYSNWNTSAGYLNKWALIFSENNIQWYNSAGGIGIGESAILNQWVHYAICRSGSTITMYRNGISIGTQTTNQNYTSIDPLVTGYINGWGYYQGYIQDLRIYKGLAKYTANFTPPERIAEIGVGFKTGALRYNTDSNKVELYDGSQWAEVQSSRPDLNGGARAVFGGGYDATLLKTEIDYININSTGNAQNFGNLSIARETLYGASSNTRAVFVGGGTATNVMDYVTISSTGNAVDFGDKTTASGNNSGGCSNQTRGIFNGGNLTPFLPINNIDYITIASTGRSVSFGVLTAKSTQQASCASPVRGIFAGGYAPGTPHNDALIEFVTISTLGNGQEFGELTASQNIRMGGCSNSTRGLFGGGQPRSATAIDLITIASLGNAINFGDLTLARTFLTATASPTRGVFSGGSPYPGPYAGVDRIDYVTISTQGNAVDFGNLSVARGRAKGLSNAHGGL